MGFYGYYEEDWNVVPADPTSGVSLEVPSEEDIVTIFGEGGDEGEAWCYGELKDGRFFVCDEWWDYTFSGGTLTFAKSREEIERYGLSAGQRERLGIVLPELEA